VLISLLSWPGNAAGKKPDFGPGLLFNAGHFFYNLKTDMELFEAATEDKFQPLAYRMRPRTLDEFAGQEHIVGQGRLLRRAIQADQLSSLIFYGPPGTGKTTLARVIAGSTRSRFITINAVLCGVKQLREVIDEAKQERALYDKRSILFVDEVHRWNKAQQDALLPWVERGTVIFIGATTQNPFFEVNSALLSRSRIFQLLPLTADDLAAIARQALGDRERGYGKYNVRLDDDALRHIVHIAAGDARSLLNALELAVETTPAIFPPPDDSPIHITLPIAEESIQKRVVLYDKEGDYHFDVISAFIKSLRGSDPDAALYWLAKMVHAGEDPKFIFRRMLIFAGEDVGLADPQALVVAEAAARAFERVGMPEGRYHLALATLYLSTAPKSNSAMAFFDALACVKQEEQADVPAHLKDGSRDKQGFGHGEGYLYPHAYRDHWVAQQYLPHNLQGRVFYQPGQIGYEAGIRNEVIKRREAQLAVMLEEPVPDILTFTPDTRQKDEWLKRAINTGGRVPADMREAVFSHLPLQRHHCVLDLNAGSGLFLWEALRRVPEGSVYALTGNDSEYETLNHFAGGLPEQERPQFVRQSLDTLTLPLQSTMLKHIRFDAVVGRNNFTRLKDKPETLGVIHSLCKDGGFLGLAQVVPVKGSRLSELVSGKGAGGKAVEYLVRAEDRIYTAPDNPLVCWNEEDLWAACEQAGFSLIWNEVKTYHEKRRLSADLVDKWFDPDAPHLGYGKVLMEFLNRDEFALVKDSVSGELSDSIADWKVTVAMLVAKKQ
jgi:putative ATPase